MRKIIAGLFMALDGVVESPDKWQLPYFNDEMGAVIQSQMADSDAMLLGRRTYQEFAGFWPDQGSDEPFADYINNIPKLVVSTTLETVEWHNSTLLKGDVAQELGKLKRQPGKNINLTGSPTLVDWLLRQGLLDELQLLVCPIVVGSGRRLFQDQSDPAPLKLLDAKTFKTGVLSLTYVPAADAST